MLLGRRRARDSHCGERLFFINLDPRSFIAMDTSARKAMGLEAAEESLFPDILRSAMAFALGLKIVAASCPAHNGDALLETARAQEDLS